MVYGNDLVESYQDEIEASSVDEFVHLKTILEAHQNRTITHMSELLKLYGGQLQTTFPNVAIAVSIHLTISVNNFQGRGVIFNITTYDRLSLEHRESEKVDSIEATVY
ncbi:hypothetical protein DPMN_065850 [Dreissena polymorpha]|uniref:Uncharacterized protein n=1 Tax=Dreissena polymorpha TaxID=45954 RepID=A0A9D3YVA9_DREPO|nr:hypothetical protein DPMN_065850 [Dreissena polymorpha]